MRTGERFVITWVSRSFRDWVFKQCKNPRAVMVGVTFIIEITSNNTRIELKVKTLTKDELSGFHPDVLVVICVIEENDKSLRFSKLTFATSMGDDIFEIL